MKLIFASNNLHKLEEVRKILPAEVCVLSLNDIGFHHDIEETGTTLSENSRIKAEAVHEWLQHHPEVEWDGIFADDTGLEIAALNGAPGVYTARWAGEDCVAANNRAKALNELQGETNRAARFRTVVTLIRGEKTEQVDGIVDGEIATEERGEGGFGYDPVFIPAGYDKTFAELPAETKNSISHRARAMEALRKILMLIAVFVGTISSWAGTWKSYFAYTSVTQIAETQDKIFALSEGALFSVEKLTEQTATYDGLSGLHSTGIRYIFSDSTTGKLVVMYTDGKMDILQSNGKFIYSSDLYNKQMIESKRINNATVENGMAYMAMPFGILVYDLRKEEFAATYLIGDSAKNVNVVDVVLHSDSIFAIGDSLTYAAARNTDLRNYQSWHTELRSNRIVPDANKGKVITDASGTIWRAGGSNGVQCTRVTGDQKNYLPNGPLNNNPYYLHCTADKLYMLNGGRWASQYQREPHVMILENGTWTNIKGDAVRQQVKNNDLKDFMEVAEDPADPAHYFICSYGCGVVEFRDHQAVAHYLSENSTLSSCVAQYPNNYTRCSGLTLAENGDLYVLQSNDVVYRGCIRKADGTWGGINYLINKDVITSGTTGTIIIDKRYPNVKYWVSARSSEVGLICSNDNGTPYDDTDDITIKCKTWVDQDSCIIDVTAIYHVYQTSNGNLWISTDQGLIMIPDTTNIFQTNTCYRLIFETPEGEEKNKQINAVCQDIHDDVWIGTNDMGVFVVSDDAKNRVAHYTADNSLMPSNCVLSIASHPQEDIVYVGTGAGVVSYADEGEETDVKNSLSSEDAGWTGQWKLHPSYCDVSQVICSAREVFGLSNGSVFSVNQQSNIITAYDKTQGLSGSQISHMAYDKATNNVVFVYQSGMIDIIRNNFIYPMKDYYLKAVDQNVVPNQVVAKNGRLYLAMEFGISEINLQKREVVGTYYIGHNASAVNVQSICVTEDSIFAMASDTLYSVSLADNAIDYNSWHRTVLPNGKKREKILSYNNRLFLFADSALYCRNTNTWDAVSKGQLNWVNAGGEQLLAYQTGRGLMRLWDGDTLSFVSSYYAKDAFCYKGEFWLASSSNGIRYVPSKGSSTTFTVNSPIDNLGYHLQAFQGRIYALSGGRWASQYNRLGNIKIYENGVWSAISYSSIQKLLGFVPRDIMSVAQDPKDGNHFFAACYGLGVLEFQDNQLVKHHGVGNSTLTTMVDEAPNNYTRTDAPVCDAEGNLYVLNMGEQGYSVNVLDRNGKWTGLNLYTSSHQRISLGTACSDMLIDNRHANWKWMGEARGGAGVILWDDNGTPTYNADDKALKRSSFVDQKGKPVLVENIYCLAQDKKGVVWVGTNAGLILIDHENFFTSDKCSRVIIRRNDGTDLADYLLAEEQINAIAVDGGNRKWIGTANSGIYLVSADGQEIIHHFTAENSNLPSSEILSIAINSESGDVFVGTAAGIASYRSDATEPKEDMSSVYAYPNPVRPDYVGEIAITGLMDNSWVNIVDAGGYIVCKTRSYGGTATWDGCDQNGKRVATGIYSALCNAGDGSGHTVVKILIMNR